MAAKLIYRCHEVRSKRGEGQSDDDE